MRGVLWACAVWCASTVAAQTRADVAATVGIAGNLKPDSLQGEAAVRLDASRTFERFTVSAALVGTLNERLGLTDLGSFLGVGLRVADVASLRVELYPFNGVRVRDTFDFANVAGLPIANRHIYPLMRVLLQHQVFEVWAALSGYPILDNVQQEQAVAWSGRLGFAVRLPKGVSVEARGAVHDRNAIPSLANQGIERNVLAVTGAARLAWTYGGGVSQQVDLFTYAADPERFERFFAPEAYASRVGAWVGLEGGVLSQNLTDAMRFGETRRVTTGYADLQARLRVGNARFFLTGRFQPIDFIQFDVPGLPPFTALEGVGPRPRIGAWLGADYRIDRADLEVGLQLRVISPATLQSCGLVPLGGNNPSGQCTRPIVIYAPNQLGILPLGASTRPIPGGMVSLRYSPMRALVLVTAFDYERDDNGTVFDPAGSGTAEPMLRVRERLTFKLYAQAKF